MKSLKPFLTALAILIGSALVLAVFALIVAEFIVGGVNCTLPIIFPTSLPTFNAPVATGIATFTPMSADPCFDLTVS
jgi:hypothetical protein